MNTSFLLENIEIPVAEGVAIKIGKLETEVQDYNLLDGLKVAQAGPAILREIKGVILEGAKEVKALLDQIQLDREKAFQSMEMTNWNDGNSPSLDFEHQDGCDCRECEEKNIDETASTLEAVMLFDKGIYRVPGGVFTVTYKSDSADADVWKESASPIQVKVIHAHQDAVDKAVEVELAKGQHVDVTV